MEIPKSRVARTTVAVGLAGLALAGCASKQEKPASIEACQVGWADEANKVADQTQAHYNMQSAISSLSDRLSQAAYGDGNSMDEVPAIAVPAKLKGATTYVFNENSMTDAYVLDGSPLARPANEFCKANDGLHLTPAYIGATAALHTIGIEVVS